MMNFNNFPQPPYQPQQQYPMGYPQQMGYQPQAYNVQTGVPVQAEVVPPQQNNHGMFSGLIGTNVPVENTNIVPANKEETSITTTKKKTKKNEIDKISSKDIVEGTVYAETYHDTNNMAFGIIAQADELLNNAKTELDYIRTRNIKGKYIYMNNMLASMSSLMSTKLQAIREINTTIKNANDAEYRRFKDTRAIDQANDSKAVMDAYKAFISAPVGAPEYHLPNTFDLTTASNGVMPVDLSNVVAANGQQPVQSADPGFDNYMRSLTPEENYMLNGDNPDYEEVVVYDQSTGLKSFEWINSKTGEPVPNMPKTSDSMLEDFVIDPRTRTARNTNLNLVKKVVYVNEDKFNEF